MKPGLSTKRRLQLRSQRRLSLLAAVCQHEHVLARPSG